MIERSLGVTIGDRTREWVKALPMRKLAGKLVLAAASLYSDRIRAGLKKNKMKHKKNIFSTFVQCATLNTTTIPSNYFSFATFVFVVCAMRAHHTNANKVSLFCLLFASLVFHVLFEGKKFFSASWKPMSKKQYYRKHTQYTQEPGKVAHVLEMKENSKIPFFYYRLNSPAIWAHTKHSHFFTLTTAWCSLVYINLLNCVSWRQHKHNPFNVPARCVLQTFFSFTILKFVFILPFPEVGKIITICVRKQKNVVFIS